MSNKFKCGDRVVVGDLFGEVIAIELNKNFISHNRSYSYEIKYDNIDGTDWFDEDEIILVENTNIEMETKETGASKFKVGDIVTVENGSIGEITDIRECITATPDKPICYYRYEVTSDIFVKWFTEEDLERFIEESCETPNKPYYDVQRNVTVEEVEKLEEELRRKNSELRDLKELIIKLLFDRYGF